jgi:hypothetical protein
MRKFFFVFLALANLSPTRAAEPAPPFFQLDLSTATLPPELRWVPEGPKGEPSLRVDVPPEGNTGTFLASVPLDLAVGVPLWEIEPVLALVVGALLLAGLTPPRERPPPGTPPVSIEEMNETIASGWAGELDDHD